MNGSCHTFHSSDRITNIDSAYTWMNESCRKEWSGHITKNEWVMSYEGVMWYIAFQRSHVIHSIPLWWASCIPNIDPAYTWTSQLIRMNESCRKEWMSHVAKNEWGRVVCTSHVTHIIPVIGTMDHEHRPRIHVNESCVWMSHVAWKISHIVENECVGSYVCVMSHVSFQWSASWITNIKPCI